MKRAPPRILASVRGVRRAAGFAWLLLSVDVLDELASGVPGAGAAGIQADFDVAYAGMGGLLTAFGLLALVVEPPLLFLADRYPRRWFVCGGLAGLGCSCLLAAAASSYWWLFVALLLFGPLSGCGVSVSQATLVDSDPERAERWLTRWTLAGALGDLATPALLALTVASGSGWRGAFVVCGALALVQSALLWSRVFPDERPAESEEPPESPPWREAIRAALEERSLLVWGSALVACSLLDEILVAFATLRMTRELGFSVEEALSVVACLSAGAVVGLLVAERLLDRFEPTRLLRFACFATLGALAFFVAAVTPPTARLAALALGAAATLLYPLAKARLYRALPGCSGTAIAVAGLFAPLDLALPVLLGLLADARGLEVTLLALGAQPLVLLLASRVGSEDGCGAGRPD